MFNAVTRSFQVRGRFTIIQLITIATMLHAVVREWRDLDLVGGCREFSYLLLASSQSASIGDSSQRTQSSNSSLRKFRLCTSSELQQYSIVALNRFVDKSQRRYHCYTLKQLDTSSNGIYAGQKPLAHCVIPSLCSGITQQRPRVSKSHRSHGLGI